MKSHDEFILYLSRQDVEHLCQQIDSTEVIREVFRLHALGQTQLPDEAYMGWVNEEGEQVRSLNMPGYVGGAFAMAGTKIINGNPANPSRGLPRASGVTLLYDKTSVRVLTIMESAYISSLRTASVTMLSIDLLKGTDITSAAIIGAGVLAQAHIELLAKRVPSLQEIRLFDIEQARVDALISRLAPLLSKNGIKIRATTSAENAIRQTQLVVPTTTTTVGYIPFEWIEPGALLVNISLDDFLPDVVLQADKVIVDDWKLVSNDPRRLLGRMYRQGQVIGFNDEVTPGVRQIDAELGDIVLGKKAGRSSRDEIILFNPFGLAIEDVAIATVVYQLALEQKVGVQLSR